MAISNLVRNLRDGELIIRDGASRSISVLLDQGDLSWTQREQTIEIKDRGSIEHGHLRRGEDESVSLSFSARWTQLIGEQDDPLQLYEMLTFTPGRGVVSTSSVGQQQTLTFEFRVVDPAGIANETIMFSKVYQESLTMSEGAESNMISFSGRAFQTRPEISRTPSPAT